MITKFKIFEYQQDVPQIGDYVKIYDDFFDMGAIEFFKTHIGKIIEIRGNDIDASGNCLINHYPYVVEFEEEIPAYGRNTTMNFSEEEIVEWAPAIDLFDTAKDTRKYNL